MQKAELRGYRCITSSAALMAGMLACSEATPTEVRPPVRSAYVLDSLWGEPFPVQYYGTSGTHLYLVADTLVFAQNGTLEHRYATSIGSGGKPGYAPPDTSPSTLTHEAATWVWIDSGITMFLPPSTDFFDADTVHASIAHNGSMRYLRRGAPFVYRSIGGVLAP